MIVNPQELEQCLLEKEEELRMTQSKAAEMEQELYTALQEKQVSDALSFRNLLSCYWGEILPFSALVKRFAQFEQQMLWGSETGVN